MPPSATKKRSAAEDAGKKTGFVMAIIDSASIASLPSGHQVRTSGIAGIREFFRQFFARAFDLYRPELHYMRGPGPAWRARHVAVSPAVQSMVAEIRSAKASRPAAPH